MNALFTGVSGMMATQQAVDVIANNIANLNTVAYKSERATFEEALVRTLAISRGGNPQQIGLGVDVATIDPLMTQGTPKSTGRTLDLALVGRSYFAVTDGEATRYTRDGVMNLDEQNRLIMSGTGLQVIGWMADAAQHIDTTAPPTGGMSIPLGESNARQTEHVTLGGNLDATGASSQLTFDVYDSLGAAHSVTVRLAKNIATPGAWDWSITSPDGTPAAGTSTGTVTFDTKGVASTGTTGAVALALTTPNGAAPQVQFALDFTGVTQIAGTDNVQATAQDGLSRGVLENYAIDSAGVITGTYSNGANRILGEIALATFANPNGLSRADGNLWDISPASGLASLQTADASGTQIRSGALESSNVDLASEFANLIVTQRSYQANSRSVTTADEMLQEMLQLKR